MKINQSSFLLFLLPAISAALADTTYNDNIDARVSRETVGNNARLVDSDVVASNVAKGAPDVPVDGKDGKPHAGPWVETNADRDSKVAKGSDDNDPVSTKYDIKLSSSEHLSTEEGKVIPHSNGGVMDDPYRAGPREGTRGTEGGVSEKGQGNQLVAEKVPGGPKEAPPLPHSETKKLVSDSEDATTGSAIRSAEGSGSLGMLEKPSGLPEKPHDIPYPKPPAVVKEDPLGLGHDSVASGSSSSSYSSSSSSSLSHDHDSGIPDAGSPMHSLIFSFTMILVSEIGDKTFLVAALMAMRHDRLVVFSAAFSALIGMTVLSAVLGHAVPSLIPKTFTKFMAAILFLVFGVKMLKEGREMSPDEGVGEEMREVEAELEEKEHEQLRMNRRRSSVTPHNLEAGRAGRPKTRGSGNRLPSPPESLSSSSSRGSSPQPRKRFNNAVSGLSNLFSLLLSPAWVQTFVMTFLGEWGDRSQIATIAMAAGQDYWWVTIGASAGHGICTAAAVIGGRAIAGRVSMRVVTLGGAVAFLVFGVIYFIEAIF
ncbi:hypothetical protein N7517_004668 [Penicillium concentricum]|uniref:GDT1 family protein n=1 Tax=Penicillium concentricum TaxID=293559 RepID=A0A9W9S6S2_9EURO|nr:uncharacterized protein N7517_004668 [Penicillium concentricum]KAJ5372662.1 hypothetical protein N7517_004668 [Penicillium concentricum]